jgi:hypothetical protein
MRWAGSHGGRLVLRHVPAERTAAAEADVAAALEPSRADDGMLTLTTTFRIVAARS